MFSHPVILVATDFSPFSDLAIKAAESLRRKSSGKLHVVHVMEHMSELNFFPDVNKAEVMGSFSKMLTEQVKRCEASCTSEVLMGRPYKVLHDLIQQTQADVLVMGHRGTGDDNFHLGGLTSKMVSSADVPVLVVGQPLEAGAVAGLVDPLDPAAGIIESTEEMAWLFGAKAQVIALWQDITAQTARRVPGLTATHEKYTESEREAITDKMQELIRNKLGSDSNTAIKVAITDHKNIAEALVRTMEDGGVGLGVMCRHKKGVVENILIGSVTRKVLERFKGNLLVLPPLYRRGKA